MSLLTDEEILKMAYPVRHCDLDDDEESIAIHFARAIEEAVLRKLLEQSDPVVIVGDVYQLLWFGSSPIAAITSKHGIKVGDKLYTRPAPQSEWQPIETAPKDGTRILIKGDCVVVAGWEEIGGMFGLMGWSIVNDSWMASSAATHWMPLPKPPEAK